MILLSLLLAAPARAACTYAQTTYADAVEVLLTAGPGEVPCRTVAFTAATPLTLSATLFGGDGRSRRLKGEALRRLPGGGWEVRAPLLQRGDRIEARLDGAPEGLQVSLGGAPAATPEDARRERTLSLALDPKHPGWGFADPARATTTVHDAWRFGEDAPAQVVPFPGAAGTGEAAPGASAPLPDGLRWGGGTGEAVVEWTVGGAPPQGNEVIPPGALILDAPGVRLVTAAGEGVTAVASDRGVRFDAPAGGRVRWRVESALGVPVIPDRATFVAGLDWRFSRASLPEPAMPPGWKARGGDDPVPARLLDAVRERIDFHYAEADPLAPRPLNRAWQSGWMTSVERGLVLHRLLLQEHEQAAWVLTGTDADPATLTGFDELLVLVQGQDGELWLDPGCRVCAPGEIAPRHMGLPALGGAEAIPRQPGTLVRRMRLEDTSFLVRFEASGAAALWLREQVARMDLPRRGDRIAAALGLDDATVLGHSLSLLPDEQDAMLDGAERLAAPDGSVVIELRTGRPPRPPADDAPPWQGGWSDDL